MFSTTHQNQRLLFWAAIVVVSAVSLWFRLTDLHASMALQDSVGPYLAAARMDGRGHAPAYGIAMLPPYLLAIGVSSSLMGAYGLVTVFHSAVGPVAAWLGSRIDAAPGAVLLVGLLGAIDPGLMDTVRSGAEGYLAPLFVGLSALLPGGYAWLALAIAVANHPLALAALPLVVRPETTSRRAVPGFCVACLVVLHQGLGWTNPGVADAAATVASAFEAYVATGGPAGVAVLAGPAVGLCFRSTRPIAIRALIALGLLMSMGWAGGYLRDHHLRLLTLPALACWAAIPRLSFVLVASILLLPRGNPMPPEVYGRPGTIGLVDLVATSVADQTGPVVVDRMWVSGGPAVEPSAIMLDLYLRGWRADRFSVDGRKIIVTAAAEADGQRHGFPGSVLLTGYGYAVSIASDREVLGWSAGPCAAGGKPGGAWDGLSVFSPNVSVVDVGKWWACE